MGNRWGNNGNTVRLYFLGLQKSLQMVIVAMKLRRLLLGRKVMTNLDSILKSRDITLPTKVRLVKAMVFPVVMYGCESWTVKKAGRQRIDAFELWCWRRLLRVPWTARRSNQSILKINPGISLEGMMLKLKLQYLATSCKELTHWKRLWCWEGLGTGVFSFSIIPSKEIQGWFPLEWTGWISLQSKGLSRVFSNTAGQKHQFFTVQLSHPYITTGKTIALTRRTLVGKVMSLLLNMLSIWIINLALDYFSPCSMNKFLCLSPCPVLGLDWYLHA